MKKSITIGKSPNGKDVTVYIQKHTKKLGIAYSCKGRGEINPSGAIFAPEWVAEMLLPFEKEVKKLRDSIYCIEFSAPWKGFFQTEATKNPLSATCNQAKRNAYFKH